MRITLRPARSAAALCDAASAMPATKAKLSREALAAAPWAAHLVASFPPAPGGDASSRLALGTSRYPAELEAEVEAETRALLAARAASAAAASTAPSIPTFFRPKSDVGFLAEELRNTAHRVALQYKERGLLEDDELEALWNAITDVIARRPPDTPSPSRALRVLPVPPDGAPADQADAESRVSYDELQSVRREFAARLDAASEAAGGPGAGGVNDGDARVAHYFSARTFNRFERDERGRINGRTFMEFVVRHIALTQSRINLGCHDGDADGWLEEEELEEFVGRSVTTMAALQSLTSQFMPRYCTIATRRFMFFNDPHRRGRARISTLLAGDALADFNELHAASEDDPQLAKNWFSLASARETYQKFMNLDRDMNGTLSREEFAQCTVDPRIADQCSSQGLTETFVARLFEEHSLKSPAAAKAAREAMANPVASSSDPFIAKQMEKRRRQIAGEMDFHAYLDFVLAWGDKNHPTSLAYFFRVLDVNKTGALTNMEIWTFLKSVHETWTADPDNYELNMLDVRDEIFDMVKPETPGRITLEDLKRCGCAHTVIEILCDHTGFWKYDNRESLPHDDEEDDEIEEEEGVDMAAEDDEGF